MSDAMRDDSRRTEHRLILASRVNGTPVFNDGGEKVGHVDDLSIEKTSGRVIYGIMSFGGFLGIGEKFHPIPWSMLTYDPEKAGFVVPLDRSALEGAPYYDRAELASLGGASPQSIDARIFDYYGPYGPLPYW
ncbi:PRC-barrel domain-containing protein [Sphingomonadaceae bacterium G21617-S1]|uniref:PRC-barrel domain-containing protein n=1 Tax=Rhizorhabdus sp. TaxID=1968843 RepID=UPI0019CD3532|nr:PRC-barrel domain-containing protein [Rhizorhabdus sp.]MBD3759895.1 PRC-barrel domain-containing protein [Rhizorhabdus sp.]MCZ4342649.1 PRC-barrel domain-containing protein [Sphingomonadaceae bacterium G21617-S1]